MKAEILRSRLSEYELRRRLRLDTNLHPFARFSLSLLNHQRDEVAPLLLMKLLRSAFRNEIYDPKRDRHSPDQGAAFAEKNCFQRVRQATRFRPGSHVGAENRGCRKLPVSDRFRREFFD